MYFLSIGIDLLVQIYSIEYIVSGTAPGTIFKYSFDGYFISLTRLTSQ